MAWAPPEASKQPWIPPEISAPPASDEAVAEGDPSDPYAGASTGASEALAHTIVGGALGAGAKLAGRVADILPGGADWNPSKPRKADTWSEAAGHVLAPTTEAGKGAEESVGKAGAAVGRAAAKVPGVNTPAGQTALSATGEVLQDLPFLGGAASLAEGIGGLGMREAGTIKNFGRPEPTAPSKPGGFTLDDFAPKPASPEAAPATNAPPPAPEAPPTQLAAPGAPKKLKVKLKPQEQVPAAGAPAAQPEAPAPAATPDAAPDRHGAPPPDTHDPNFFPAPDNKGTHTRDATPAEQTAREAVVQRGAPTLQTVRDSAITNNYEDQHRDWAGNQAAHPVATAQVGAENAALHEEAGRISAETGGQQGTGEAADTIRGQDYQKWHDATVDALNKHIDAAYANEDAKAQQLFSAGNNVRAVLNKNSLITGADAAHVRNSVHSLATEMGVDLNSQSPVSSYQLEQLRKHVSKNFARAPEFVTAMKKAIEADQHPGAYVQARGLQKLKSQMFDNNDGINQLGASKDIDPDTGKPRPENRPVKAGDVMKKIEGMDPGQVRHIMGTMKRSAQVLENLGDHAAATDLAPKALKAAQQIQSHFTERWRQEASKGGGWNQRAAHQFLRNNQETLNAVMHPNQMHEIRNVHNAANVLDMDKGYKGAFAQFAHGAGWKRRIGGALGVAGARMGLAKLTMGGSIAAEEGLNVLSGGRVDRAIADLQTGKTDKPPKGFTRPLGAQMGGKQRGAVGHLNAPGIVHDYEKSTGHHEVQSPNGVTHANDHFNGKDIVMDNTRTEPVGRGTGEGMLRTKKLADAAIARGGELRSDDIVSSDQQKVYASLKNAGYKVERNPNAVYATAGNDALTLHAPAGEAVFRVSKPLLGDVKQAGGIPGEKLGANPAFRRQAGAVSFGGDIYDRTPKKDVWSNERVQNDRTNAKDQRASDPYNSGGGNATPMGQRLAGRGQRGSVSGKKTGPNIIERLRGQKEAEPETPAKVNIGLHVNGGPAAGGSVLDGRVAKAALKSQGVEVGKTSIQNPPGGEPTLVADINRPLAPHEMQSLLKKTGQSAIPQRLKNGEGEIHVAPGHEKIAKEQGWDQYNPDYFQMHDGRSATEHDAENTAFDQIKPHMTPEEIASIENRAPQHRATAIKNLVDVFHGSTPTEGAAAMALAGQAKKGWYKASGRAIHTVYGPDAPRFTALLAAMSPQTSVEINFHNAVHVFKAWDEAGRPTSHDAITKIMEDNSLKNPESKSESNVMEAWRQNGIRALTSKDPEHESFQLSGPKVNSFYQNLRDNVHEVTNDSWNAIALNVAQSLFGGVYKKVAGDIFGKLGFKSPGYMGASAKVRAAADLLTKMTGDKWTTHETQETMWSFAKTAMEYNENAAKEAKLKGLPKPADKTIPQLIKEGLINDDLIRSTPDFAQLFGAPEHSNVFATGRFAKGARKLAAEQKRSPAGSAAPGEKSQAAAAALRPDLLEQADRLEGIRQQRIADKAAGHKERQIGNIQVPF